MEGVAPSLKNLDNTLFVKCTPKEFGKTHYVVRFSSPTGTSHLPKGREGKRVFHGRGPIVESVREKLAVLLVPRQLCELRLTRRSVARIGSDGPRDIVAPDELRRRLHEDFPEAPFGGFEAQLLADCVDALDVCEEVVSAALVSAGNDELSGRDAGFLIQVETGASDDFDEDPLGSVLSQVLCLQLAHDVVHVHHFFFTFLFVFLSVGFRYRAPRDTRPNAVWVD